MWAQYKNLRRNVGYLYYEKIHQKSKQSFNKNSFNSRRSRYYPKDVDKNYQQSMNETRTKTIPVPILETRIRIMGG